jgi:hypothetical protein
MKNKISDKEVRKLIGIKSKGKTKHIVEYYYLTKKYYVDLQI